MISFIVALAENGTIGAGGSIPWRIPGEQAYFKRVTMGHPIVMGRKTYESIGKPLPGRDNYIMTRDKNYEAPAGCRVVHTVDVILQLARTENVFIIGGAQVYDLFFPHADMVYATIVHQPYEGDTFFPQLDDDHWSLIQSQPGPSDVVPHTFRVYQRRAGAGAESR